MKYSFLAFGAATSTFALMGSTALAAVLSVGTADGSVSILVNGVGESEGAIFDPFGDEFEASNVFFESFVYLPVESGRSNLSSILGISTSETDGESGPVTITGQTESSLDSVFSIGTFDVSLSQSLTESFENDIPIGATFTQRYTITNTGVAQNFDIVRYLDADLDFDGSIEDSGGGLDIAGNRVLFEVEAGVGGNASTTFVGIISSVSGAASTEQRFEIDQYDDLQIRLENGEDLRNLVVGDTDDDGFIDGTYDVTLALQELGQIGAGETFVYTTQTLFGNAVPPAPGSSEAQPLLPTETIDNSFVFRIDRDDIIEERTFFIDPDIAIGYTYEVTGADFFSVTAPTFGAVPDPDGFLLVAGGTTTSLASGQTIELLSGTRSFRIEGIDTDLMLSPDDQTAFVTGIALTNLDAFQGPITITQTPITASTDISPVPLPAGFGLLAGALAFLGGGAGLRRSRQNSIC